MRMHVRPGIKVDRNRLQEGEPDHHGSCDDKCSYYILGILVTCGTKGAF